MPATPPTKTGKLSDVARHVVQPTGIVSTGWPAVRDTCAGFGVRFDPWQDGAGRLILAKRADGSYACSVGGAVLSIPRQVGKTFLIGAVVFALCMLHPNLTVLWTAHRLRTANETFAKMKAFADRRKVKPHVRRIVLAAGEQAVEFHNGSRIMFGARERGFGRGFDNVDVEVFDEAQILTENAIDDMVPATNTAKNPLLLYVGTPPKPSDPSEVFTMKRTEALKGETDDTVYIEFSADENCNTMDRAQWRKANPSFPSRTNEAAMQRMLKNLTPESFVREGLGVWDPTDDGRPINLGLWASSGDEDDADFDPSTLTDVRLALSAPRGLRGATFAIAGVHPDGGRYVQVRRNVPVIERDDPRSLRERVVDLASKLTEGHNTALIIPAGDPCRAWVTEFTEAKVKLDELTGVEYTEACSGIQSAVSDGDLRHRNQPEMNAAVEALVIRSSGDLDVWSRRSSKANIAPFVAATCALYRVPQVSARVEPWVVVG